MKEQMIRLPQKMTEDNRCHIHVTNPLDGMENTITVTITHEGIIVDIWGDSTDWPEASVHSLWSDLVEDEESENEKEST